MAEIAIERLVTQWRRPQVSRAPRIPPVESRVWACVRTACASRGADHVSDVPCPCSVLVDGELILDRIRCEYRAKCLDLGQVSALLENRSVLGQVVSQWDISPKHSSSRGDGYQPLA